MQSFPRLSAPPYPAPLEAASITAAKLHFSVIYQLFTAHSQFLTNFSDFVSDSVFSLNTTMI